MKFFIVFAAILAIAVAAPLAPEAPEVKVLRSDSEVNADGYTFNLETSDGVVRSEEGHLINPGAENEGIVVKGSYQFIADDGQLYKIDFVADENGFQPQGAHLPVAPSV